MNSKLSPSVESSLVAKPTRLYYIDWLRVLAMLTIFFFHNSRFFVPNPWHLNNAETSLGLEIFEDFCNLWLMPIFFLLAGASVYYALKSRTAGGFTKERILRILIPIITLGFFVIGPPQVYLERLANGDFSGNFLQFYFSDYFNGFYGLGGNFALVPLHMWFLWLLFIFSLILLPIFLPRKGSGRSLGSRLATLFEKPWTFVVPVFLLAVSEVLLDPLGDMMSWGGGWNHLSYLLFLIAGYLIISNTRIMENIKKYAVTALIAALVLQALHYMLWFRVIQIDIWDGTAGHMVYQVFYNLRSWFFIAVIASTSFIAIMAIYELLARRINVLRFLFGMRLKKKPKLA